MARKPGKVAAPRPDGNAANRSAAAEQAEAAAESRPSAPGLRGLARAHAAAAVDALAAVMRDPSATPAARVSAAGALLAWGYGKAAPGEAERGRRASEQVVRLVWGGDDA
jgi:hypothetical protein